MANYESATIYPGSKQAFTAIEKYFSDERNHFGFFEADETKGKIGVRNRHRHTINRLIDLSVFYPNDYVFVDISYESERYEYTHRYNVINGNLNELSIMEIKYEAEEETTVEIEKDEDEVEIPKDNPFALSEEEQKRADELAEIMDEIFGGK